MQDSEGSIKAVLDNMTTSTKAQLDTLAIEFNSTRHKKHRGSFPTTNFVSRPIKLTRM